MLKRHERGCRNVGPLGTTLMPLQEAPVADVFACDAIDDQGDLGLVRWNTIKDRAFARNVRPVFSPSVRCEVSNLNDKIDSDDRILQQEPMCRPEIPEWRARKARSCLEMITISKARFVASIRVWQFKQQSQE